MIKLLIEKDKTRISDEIPLLIETKLPRTHVNKQENKKYVMLYISPLNIAKRKRHRAAVRIMKTTACLLAQYIMTNVTSLLACDAITSMQFTPANGIDKSRICNIVCEDIIKNTKYRLNHKKTDNWYSVLQCRVLKNMLEYGIFAVNAFIRFRIDDYKKHVRECTTSVVERINRENKYIEFIGSLQYFVDTRSSKIRELVIKVDDNGYMLYDNNGRPIDISIYEQAKDDDTDKEDLLMGILLSAAPKRITICADAGFYDSDFFSSLANIFGNRLQACYSNE